MLYLEYTLEKQKDLMKKETKRLRQLFSRCVLIFFSFALNLNKSRFLPFIK